MARRRLKILDILQLKHGEFTRFGHDLVPGTLILRPQILKIFACGANFLFFFQKPYFFFGRGDPPTPPSPPTYLINRFQKKLVPYDQGPV